MNSSLYTTAAVAGAPLLSQSLLGAAVVDFAVQWIGWAFASWFQTEKFYDLTGSLTFIGLSVGTLVFGGQYAPRQVLLSGMVVAWAARLGSFLVARIMNDGKDGRFDEAKKNPSTFFVYWTIQGVWVWVTMLPTLLVNGMTHHPSPGVLDGVGLTIWLLGFSMEATADWQKFQFKRNPENAGKFIDSGLWQYSRHPNYCGEMMMWWGVYITAATSLKSSVLNLAVGALSPTFVMALLLFVSGVPLLEQAADKKWGQDPAYQEYKKRTWSIVPLPVPRSR